MKIKVLSQFIIASFTAASILSLTSCFKDEPLNAECDIEQAYIATNGEWENFFLNATDTLKNVMSTDQEISFLVKRGTDLSHFAPKFNLTSGATLSPANGSEQDFTNGPVIYTVTSEDGNWKRQYKVSFTFPPVIYEEMKYDFENFFLNENKPIHRYYVWSDKNDDGTLANNWATGNPGFNMSKGSAKPYEYPTVPVKEGYDGACVKLTTSDTGSFGSAAKMPIAAGNLFIGKFDATQALKDAMKATQFGVPVSFKPTRFSGYYKYKRGDVFTNRQKKVVEGKKDYGTIYAVFYDNHDAEGNSIVLYGDNVQTSPQVVAIAKLPDIDDTPEWTHFDLDFVYKKEVDAQKLRNMGYSMAIVCSSSVEGASFMGAIGSTLWVDQFRIACEKE